MHGSLAIPQAPGNLNVNSGHKPAAFLEVETMRTRWGGIDAILEVKRHAWMYHQSICKVERAMPKRDGFVVWVVGGGDVGIHYKVEANFKWKGVTNPLSDPKLVNGEPAYTRIRQFVHAKYDEWIEPVTYAALDASDGWLPEKLYAYQ